MSTPISKQKHSMIVNSVKRVFESGDINQLTKTAYNYLYLCSGFIAHYNWGGFMDHYSNVWDLAQDIVDTAQWNTWSNFHPQDKDYAYYMSKTEVNRDLVSLAKKYLSTAIVGA